MEESKELQGFYKIFRAVIYVSILMEFFAYALEPEQLDFLGGVVTDIHTRIKRWISAAVGSAADCAVRMAVRSFDNALFLYPPFEHLALYAHFHRRCRIGAYRPRQYL